MKPHILVHDAEVEAYFTKLHIPNAETVSVLTKTERGKDVQLFNNTADLFASWD